MNNLSGAPSRLLVLKDGEFKEAVLYRLEKGWSLRFILHASLACLPVKIFVNHPLDPKDGSSKDKYREVEWVKESPESAKCDSYAQVRIVLAGSFSYFFTTNGSTNKKDARGGGHFLVDPVLLVGKRNEQISLNSICCQTVMPKLLGTFDQWSDRLRVSKESGYNMIHFTPVQELGQSDSSYCIKNQRKLDPRYSTNDKTYTMDDLKELVEKMRDEWNVLSLTDLVYNHSANESSWILENPDCSYNLVNSPHLKPAYLMDRILWHFSLEVGQGKWENRGIPAYLNQESQLLTMTWILTNEVMPKHNFCEFSQCNVEEVLNRFKNSILSGLRGDDKPSSDIVLIPDSKFARLRSRIDIAQAIKIYYSTQPTGPSQLNNACNDLRKKLQELNSEAASITMDHVNSAINSFIENARWRFVDNTGEKLGKVGPDTPLMWNYFTQPKQTLTIEEEENAMNGEDGLYCMAHNGWVMNDDPLRNFAEPGSNVYLRRELIPWGDCVKLRYGRKPEDSPFLWEYMRQYTIESATIFHGFRLDNCHSTPVHVAEYMLNEARKIRPDLYVIAELFTNSEYADNIFTNRLGINSLIREGIRSCNPSELGGLVQRYAGDPVGSFVQLNTRYITPSITHALIMDQSHDNESVIHKHTPEDLLPYSAVIAMACSAFGSNRGYDEMVPHHINVVKEKRLYKSWTSDNSMPSKLFSSIDTGIIRAKNILNNIHVNLEEGRYQEAFMEMVSDAIISVTRHNPTSHQSIVLYAHTSFYPNNRGSFDKQVKIPGIIEEIIFEGILRKNGNKEYVRDDSILNGFDNYSLEIQENIDISKSRLLRVVNPNDTNKSVVEFQNLIPGSVVILRVNIPVSVNTEVLALRKILKGLGYQVKSLSSHDVTVLHNPLHTMFGDMTLNDFNYILYRTDEEERDSGLGFRVYNVPNYGALKYCGLQGVVTLLDKIRPSNDLGHPLCENLRQGNWMMDYITDRLLAHQGTRALGKWFKGTFDILRKLPRYLIPIYFDAIVYGVYTLIVDFCWENMSSFVNNGSKFVRDLSLGSIQLCSYDKTAKLPMLSKDIEEPLPPALVDDDMEIEACLSLAAGFPHFSTGLYRNWGRDTFISIRGLLLLTGRFEDARFIILGYAGTLRHGLIPNLLGEGKCSRYNCRDAVWFWLQCIKEYCLLAPHGTDILKDAVMRLYPEDNSPVTLNYDQQLQDVVQEALQKHATGLKFRERNAIDDKMKDEGFDNSIGLDKETGFIYGGTEFNCGTWMDKMGSSEKAGNKGIPATPRDGSAVEIVGLCASVINWLGEMNKKGIYPYEGVEDENSKFHSWESWYALIKNNFEFKFWIDPNEDDPQYDQSGFINRRGIYKDSVGSTRKYTDYQLRCNFPIAITVCPDLFTPEKAWESLLIIEKHLLGPLGMKTLDPSDYNYSADYFSDDDSNNYKTAKGFNYHQGPEWLWPVGYFFRAKLLIAKILSSERPEILEETINFVEKKMMSHNDHLQSSDWKSLPELTNGYGAHCPDSCGAQAWSVGCLLEVLYDISTLRSADDTESLYDEIETSSRGSRKQSFSIDF